MNMWKSHIHHSTVKFDFTDTKNEWTSEEEKEEGEGIKYANEKSIIKTYQQHHPQATEH